MFTESLHSDGRGADRSELIVALLVVQQRATSIVMCYNMFTESLPSNALAIHVTVSLSVCVDETHPQR
jgi:hypothetical protein